MLLTIGGQCLAQGSDVNFSRMASSSSKHRLQCGERSISLAPLALFPAPHWDPAEKLESTDCLGHGGAKLQAHLVAGEMERPFLALAPLSQLCKHGLAWHWRA